MKILSKPSLYIAVMIAFAMLAHAPVSRAQRSWEPALGTPDPPRPPEPATETADAPASSAQQTGEPAPGTAEQPTSNAHSPGEPASGTADAYMARGLAHYRAGEFKKAIRAFLAGYKIEPRREFLFALGQAERQSGDCASALSYYRRFIATTPPFKQEQAARLHILNCEKALVSRPVAGEQPPVRMSRRPAPKIKRNRHRQAVVAVAPQQAPPPPAPSAPPWYHDMPGGMLLGTGTVAVLAGAGFMVASETARDRASWAATYPEYDLEISSAQRYRLWGITAMSAGTVVVAGAIYRYHRRSRQHSRETREIGISPGSGGVTISLGGQF
jgi:tetratricopeptide (TPR) repeat protein